MKSTKTSGISAVGVVCRRIMLIFFFCREKRKWIVRLGERRQKKEDKI